MDIDPERLRQYIGKSYTELPTPSLILKKDVIERNCAANLDAMRKLSVYFRAHVKSLKV
jgi:D-serine deaminase-like pyridoxal phosphate-dependent protein